MKHIFKQSVEIEQLELELERESLHKDQLKSIAARLDSLAGAINNDSLKARYQTLCGRVHWKAIDGEVDEIFDAVIEGVPDEKTRDDLLARIEKIRANHALSIESRQLITAAERQLKPDDRVKLPTEGILSVSEQDAGTLAEQLYETAERIYNGTSTAVADDFDHAIANRLREHVDYLGGSLEKLSEIESLTEHHENVMKVVRACIGFSSELTGNSDTYPTESDVRELFNSSPTT